MIPIIPAELKVLSITGLKRDEGFRPKPYKCTAGKLTIGYGRNIEDIGISERESIFLLENDIQYSYQKLYAVIPIFKELDIIRQYVLLNMCFNMGISRFVKFVKMLAALERKDYEIAAKEMLDSNWAVQVGMRATRLANLMRTGLVLDK
jgi:lysozyme